MDRTITKILEMSNLELKMTPVDESGTKNDFSGRIWN